MQTIFTEVVKSEAGWYRNEGRLLIKKDRIFIPTCFLNLVKSKCRYPISNSSKNKLPRLSKIFLNT